MIEFFFVFLMLECVVAGIAFYHAAIDVKDRDIVAELFTNQDILVRIELE